MGPGLRGVLVAVSAALGLAAAGLLACSRSHERRITIGEIDLPSQGLLFIAREQGFFRAEGVEVIRRSFPSGRDALAALLAGELDVAVAYETPVAIRAFDAPALRILTTLHSSTAGTRVVARADRGIASGADLRGKRVGVTPNTNSDFFLDALLALSGVRPDEVQRRELPFAELAPALARGEVDAVSAPLPFAVGGPLTGLPLVELRTGAYTELSMLVTRDDVLASRRPALVRLLRALARAERFTAERPAEARAALERALPSMPADVLRESWARAAPQLGLSHVLLAILQREAEWQRTRAGAWRPVPDFRALLAPALLEEVEPEAVTLIEVVAR